MNNIFISTSDVWGTVGSVTFSGCDSDLFSSSVVFGVVQMNQNNLNTFNVNILQKFVERMDCDLDAVIVVNNTNEKQYIKISFTKDVIHILCKTRCNKTKIMCNSSPNNKGELRKGINSMIQIILNAGSLEL